MAKQTLLKTIVATLFVKPRGYLLTAALLLSVASTQAADQVIDSTADTTTNWTLKQALNQQSVNDTYTFNIGSGPYVITLGSAWVGITQNNLTIDGTNDGTNFVAISGNDAFRPFHIDAPVDTFTLKNLTLQNGNATGDNGGAIQANGELMLTSNGATNFTGNTAASSGGAVYAYDALTVNNTGSLFFTGNSATYDGGAIGTSGTTTLDAILATRKLTVSGDTTSVTFANDTTFTGGVDLLGGTLTINQEFNVGAMTAESGATINITVDAATPNVAAITSTGAVNLGDATLNITLNNADQVGKGKGNATSITLVDGNGTVAFNDDIHWNATTSKLRYERDISGDDYDYETWENFDRHNLVGSMTYRW